MVNFWHFADGDYMENLLAGVERPASYIGGEYNSIVKNWQSAKARLAFCFPDTYEIGMSHLGLRVLYQAINNQPHFLCERCFSPRQDMRQGLIQAKLPLTTLESRRPLADFDVIAFTLQYELSYTNVLDTLYLAGLPLLAAKRDNNAPLIIAGGPCAYNPEPLGDFIDLFCIGEGEEQLPALLQLVSQLSKEEVLNEAVKIPGIYSPRLKNTTRKAIVSNFDTAPFPLAPLISQTQVVHDRIMLEIMRGCGRGCRFCQAGIIYRPVREKDPAVLLEQARHNTINSGYEDIALISLSSADYSHIARLMQSLTTNHGCSGVGVSLPSLRVDAFSVNLAAQAGQVRKSGLTFAPEAGSQRLRNVINKGVSEEDILAAVGAAFSQGYSTLKLYFMIGLPTETLQDIEDIARLCEKIIPLYRRLRPAYVKKPLKISLGIASFVPKAHTPFQWCPQDSIELLRQKQDYLRQKIRPLKQVTLRYHDTQTSLLEAAFARGDEKLGPVLLKAWQLGCRADGWSEHFRPDLWVEAFKACGLTQEQYANRAYSKEDILPWQHIQSGVSTAWLWQEYEKARQEALTADCRNGICSGCGVCAALKQGVKLAPAPALTNGSQTTSPPNAADNQVWRLRLGVQKNARWLSHLELLSAMEKALRRAALPIAFSQGFNPHMLISWGPAHPVGLAGNSEYLDITFAAKPPNNWQQILNGLLPEGLTVLAAKPIEPGTPALMAAIDCADYELELTGSFDAQAVDANIAALLTATSYELTRHSPKGQKTIDIRPSLLSLSRKGNTLHYSCRLGSIPAPKGHELARILAPWAKPGQPYRKAMYINGQEPLNLV